MSMNTDLVMRVQYLDPDRLRVRMRRIKQENDDGSWKQMAHGGPRALKWRSGVEHSWAVLQQRSDE
jgi:hypothetical protein